MPTNQINDISTAAAAAAECNLLPAHVRSLATTIRQMADKVGAEANPDPATTRTLMQAIHILDRWVASNDCGDGKVEQLISDAARQGSQATARRPEQVPA
ncbi:MAG: hypothetical protein KJ787_03175 [Gammaproteobacteria bacterium]|nr:hypothetical protein [Gammaproteobacteria bacterium]MBU1645316.1 hypothetical protein [Gammaproteobacteria bacterium]MBU1972309.1 hypothetical protein [Gammaproteobacteria bacterium]